MAGKVTLDQLKKMVADGSIDTVVVAMADLQGRLIGKRFQAEFFLSSGVEESHACDYLLANDIEMEPVPGYKAANWAKGYGDFVMVPDMSTLRVIPWLEGTALVQCDVLDHHGHDLAHSPRAVLKRQLARLEERGLKAMCASELEFYLFDQDYRSAFEQGYRNLKASGYYIEDYHVFQTTKEEPFMRAVRKHLQAAGVPVENSKGEWGPGQVEINVGYAEALEMADRHVLIKNAIKEIAHQQGKAVTFMAKRATDLAGSSGHIHLSLQDDEGNNLFFDENAQAGVSALMRPFVAGMLKYADDLTCLLAPYTNSYKRFQAGTFAPTRTVWSRDNRTAGFRLCGEGSKAIRIECRIGGADLNPYFAFAGLIAAGLAGLEEELDLPPAFEGDAYGDEDGSDRIPGTLREAMRALDNSKMLRAALGDPVVDHLVHGAKWELKLHDAQVTELELKRGFEQA